MSRVGKLDWDCCRRCVHRTLGDEDYWCTKLIDQDPDFSVLYDDGFGTIRCRRFVEDE